MNAVSHWHSCCMFQRGWKRVEWERVFNGRIMGWVTHTLLLLFVFSGFMPLKTDCSEPLCYRSYEGQRVKNCLEFLAFWPLKWYYILIIHLSLRVDLLSFSFLAVSFSASLYHWYVAERKLRHILYLLSFCIFLYVCCWYQRGNGRILMYILVIDLLHFLITECCV